MKKNIPFLILILLTILSSLDSRGQFFTSGQDPASYKWKVIKTNEVELIYPEGMSYFAQRVAADLECIAPIEQGEMKVQIRKPFPLVMHKGSNVSNAFVAYAPRRMEFFAVPPQDSYGQEWYMQLAIHEYRHVTQLQKMRQGLGKVLSVIFGEQATVAQFGVFAPRWLVEGDAVLTETALSTTGRGSQASFITPLKAQIVDKGLYSYSKAALGSYKDFVPDPYVLGYHITSYGKINYDEDIWGNVFDYIGRRPYQLSPLSISLHKQTDMRTSGFYNKAMSSFKERWTEETSETPALGGSRELSTPENKHYHSYKFIQAIGQNHFIALKESIDDVSRIVQVNNGKETTIAVAGYGGPNHVSVGGDWLCWDESKTDLRWENRGYQVVRLINLKTKERRTIGKKSRWFSPSLSKDGKLLAAVEVGPDNRYAIVIYDIERNVIKQRLNTDDNQFFQNPSFSDDGKHIACISFGDSGKHIREFDLISNENNSLFFSPQIDINYPIYQGEDIIFVGDFDGKNNLYQFIRRGGKIQQISYEKYGASYPDLHLNHIYYSAYTADGFKAKAAPIDHMKKTAVPANASYPFPIAAQLREMSGVVPSMDIPDTLYAEKDYKRGHHLFNLHSWAPAYISGSTQEAGIGASIASQNILGTSTAELGYIYDMNEERGKYIASYTYSGWYPKITLTADYGNRNSIAFDPPSSMYYNIEWRETNVSALIQQPLTLSKGASSTFLTPYAEYSFRNLNYISDVRYRFDQLHVYRGGIMFSHARRSSPKDLQSRWKQSLLVQYQFSPDENHPSNQFAAVGRLYFPGIIRHHGISLYMGYQHQEYGYYSFSNYVLYPRGISNQAHQELYSLRSDYVFPIAYPDWSLGKFMYMKRINARVFFDIAQGRIQNQYTDFKTTGFDIETEAHYFRFFAPINLGLRTAYDINNKEFSYQLLFTINLYAY